LPAYWLYKEPLLEKAKDFPDPIRIQQYNFKQKSQFENASFFLKGDLERLLLITGQKWDKEEKYLEIEERLSNLKVENDQLEQENINLKV